MSLMETADIIKIVGELIIAPIAVYVWRIWSEIASMKTLMYKDFVTKKDLAELLDLMRNAK